MKLENKIEKIENVIKQLEEFKDCASIWEIDMIAEAITQMEKLLLWNHTI